jgi:SAM-dependent methyltransferase
LGQKLFLQDISIGTITDWFTQFGPTDLGYLRSAFPRMVTTYHFVGALNLPPGSRILDIGAHCLHNAFLYVNDGHRLTCIDVPMLMNLEAFRRCASAMEVETIACRRLDLGEVFSSIPENSFDLVLLCEVLEHLAFNPITMWKEIYRVLRPGGRIIVSTPNSLHLPKLRRRLRLC